MPATMAPRATTLTPPCLLSPKFYVLHTIQQVQQPATWGGFGDRHRGTYLPQPATAYACHPQVQGRLQTCGCDWEPSWWRSRPTCTTEHYRKTGVEHRELCPIPAFLPSLHPLIYAIVCLPWRTCLALPLPTENTPQQLHMEKWRNLLPFIALCLLIQRTKEELVLLWRNGCWAWFLMPAAVPAYMRGGGGYLPACYLQVQQLENMQTTLEEGLCYLCLPAFSIPYLSLTPPP